MERRAIWKSRPVFITSTFQDMQAERDHLRDFVFPALEEWLRSKRRHLEWIDLRAGVATAGAKQEEARELQVLKVCLDEVKRSRPFLIGLIGDRYGWVPPKERMVAAAEEAGISGDVTDRSVTDLEIDFGVFHDEAQQRRSLFFFREPLPYDKMPPEKAADYSDAHAEDAGAASRVRQLKKLKARIKAELPGHHFDYPAEWDAKVGKVTGLKAWGEDVQAKIKQAIEEDLADEPDASAEQTDDEIERDALVDFAEDRARDFTGRTDVLKDIEALLASPATEDTPRGLCITGEAGSGKSALFAALHQGLTGVEKDADARMTDAQRALYARLRGMDALVLAHAAGASPRAPSVGDMLRRWIGELASFLGVDPALPDNAGADEVDAAFASLLGRAALKRRVVVLVDALDQFEATPRGRFVTWLPRLWPENARLIATAIPGDASEALTQRPGMAPRPLPPLDAAEARDIAIAITARYHRQLEPEVLDALIAAPDDADARWRNPLWLVLAVEELNLLDADDFARARQLPAGRDDERLRALMCDMARDYPADIPGLYRKGFERAAELFGGKLAGSFLGTIAVSRSGWRESDFRVVLPRLSGEDWDELRFAQLRRLFRGQLRQRGAMGQWDVAHAQMRAAIRGWLSDSGVAEADLHAALAQHLLDRQTNDPLRETETMLHLLSARQLFEAAVFYADPEMPKASVTGATQFLANAWLAEEINPPVKLDISAMLALPELSDNKIGHLTHRLLSDFWGSIHSPALIQSQLDLLDMTLPVLDRLTEIDPSNATWQRDLADWHDHSGELLEVKGASGAALASFQTAHDILDRLVTSDSGNPSWRFALSGLKVRLGRAYRTRGNLSQALTSFQSADDLANQQPDLDTSNTSDQSTISLSRIDDDDVQEALGNLWDALTDFQAATDAVVQPNRFDPDDIEAQAGQSTPKIGNDELQRAWGKLAWTLTGSQSHVDLSDLANKPDLNNSGLPINRFLPIIMLGEAQLAQGNLAEAMTSFQSAHDIVDHLIATDASNPVWLGGLAMSEERIGEVQQAQGNLPEALNRFQTAYQIVERLVKLEPDKVSWQDALTGPQVKIGDVQLAQGDLAAALTSYRASLEVSARLAASEPQNAGWQRNLSVGHIKIGDVLLAQGDLTAALASYQASYEVLVSLADLDPDNSSWQRDIFVSQSNIGRVQQAQGNLSTALTSFQASFAIADRLAKMESNSAVRQRDVATSHNQIGEVLQAQGNLAEALRSYRTSLSIVERLADADPTNVELQHNLIFSYAKIAEISPEQERAMLIRALSIADNLQRTGRLAQNFIFVPLQLTWRLQALETATSPEIAVDTSNKKAATASENAIAKAQRMLAANDPSGAAALLSDAPPQHGRANARAVCALRLGQTRPAIDYLQLELLPNGAVAPHKVKPEAWIVTYATALALAGDPRGAKRALGWVKNVNHPGAARLAGALDAWRQSLGWKESLSYRLTGKASRPVTIDFPPGEFE